MVNARERPLPDWACWNAFADAPWSLRICEDAMLVEPDRGVLAPLGPAPLSSLSPLLKGHAASTFDGAVVTLETTPQPAVMAAAAELALLRNELETGLREAYGVAPVATGLHPWSECSTAWPAGAARPRSVTELRGIFGRFDPMGSLSVEVTVTDPEAATRALDGLRAQLPLLLALSANSPFWRGSYTGLASTRAALRGALRDAGIPRAFGSYAAYVAAVDTLIEAGAIAGAGALGWDARLRPERGVVEIAVMDAQTRVGDVIAIAALIQSLVRLHAEREDARDDVLPELLLANRSAAAEKGMRAQLIDASGEFRQRAIDELWLVIETCAPVARELDCARELTYAGRTGADPGHARQRRAAARGGLGAVVADLMDAFCEPLLSEVTGFA